MTQSRDRGPSRTPQAKSTAKFKVDHDLIRQLAELLAETGLSEIEIGEGERRVRIARNCGPTVLSQPAAPSTPVAATPTPTDATHPGAVISPMVGTVYLAPEPGAPSFVKLGDSVKEGQTLFIVEAMKVMNPIRSPRSGKVKQILVTDGAPVEFGEALLTLE